MHWLQKTRQRFPLLSTSLEPRKALDRSAHVSAKLTWRLSDERNHGCEQRLERAALLWAIYHNFEPTQRRKENKRHYRHPGQSPLQAAGLSPGKISYLDALVI
jgi:hypothetical protein